eukprot:gene13140-61739_t
MPHRTKSDSSHHSASLASSRTDMAPLPRARSMRAGGAFELGQPPALPR